MRGGRRPFGIFPKNHPTWRSHHSQMTLAENQKKNKSTTRQNIARLMHRKFVITTRKELCEYTFCNTEGTSSGQSTFGEFYIVSKVPTNHYGQKCPSSPSIVKCGKWKMKVKRRLICHGYRLKIFIKFVSKVRYVIYRPDEFLHLWKCETLVAPRREKRGKVKGGAARTNAGQLGGWQLGKGQEGLKGLKAAVQGTAPGLPHSSIGEELEPRILCPLQMLIFRKISFATSAFERWIFQWNSFE